MGSGGRSPNGGGTYPLEAAHRRGECGGERLDLQGEALLVGTEAGRQAVEPAQDVVERGLDRGELGGGVRLGHGRSMPERAASWGPGRRSRPRVTDGSPLLGVIGVDG